MRLKLPTFINKIFALENTIDTDRTKILDDISQDLRNRGVTNTPEELEFLLIKNLGNALDYSTSKCQAILDGLQWSEKPDCAAFKKGYIKHHIPDTYKFRKNEDRTGLVPAAIAAGWGCILGGAIGALIGSIFPGFGTAIGGSIGAIFGGVATGWIISKLIVERERVVKSLLTLFGFEKLADWDDPDSKAAFWGNFIGLRSSPGINGRIAAPTAPAGVVGALVGGASGIALGGIIGGIIGSALFPGVGTAVGAAMGASVGSVIGTALGIPTSALGYYLLALANQTIVETMLKPYKKKLGLPSPDDSFFRRWARNYCDKFSLAQLVSPLTAVGGFVAGAAIGGLIVALAPPLLPFAPFVVLGGGCLGAFANGLVSGYVVYPLVASIPKFRIKTNGKWELKEGTLIETPALASTAPGGYIATTLMSAALGGIIGMAVGGPLGAAVGAATLATISATPLGLIIPSPGAIFSYTRTKIIYPFTRFFVGLNKWGVDYENLTEKQKIKFDSRNKKLALSELAEGTTAVPATKMGLITWLGNNKKLKALNPFITTQLHPKDISQGGHNGVKAFIKNAPGQTGFVSAHPWIGAVIIPAYTMFFSNPRNYESTMALLYCTLS